MERLRRNTTTVCAEELESVGHPFPLTPSLSEERSLHVSCTVCCPHVWKDLYEGKRVRRRTGVAGRGPRSPRHALESVVPMWAQVWLALSCCVTACPMQSHQPV